jgi:hypothetical protein
MIKIYFDGITGVAWLSSARAVGCSLQWGNERNPCRMLNNHMGLFEGLKFALMNVELVVIVDQQATVNTFSGLVHTARQVSKVGDTLRSAVQIQGRISDED